MPFLPLLVLLAGLTLLISRRRYKAIADRESPRVIVGGHTYSESVGDGQSSTREGKIESIRSACIIGAGHVGALTAIVLASQNPHIQFHVVDDDARLITAWNSDRLPVCEPGLDELVFEKDHHAVASEKPKKQADQEVQIHEPVLCQPRIRKLRNITFSTNIPGGIAASDIVFLCVDPPLDNSSDDQTPGLDLTNLESAIRAIVQVSSGHKIIVHRGTGPSGIVPRIKKMIKSLQPQLKKTASPSASFEVLSNPEFLVPGTAIRDLLYPVRIIIGHIFSEDMSPQALTALKGLYSWIPEDRIVTMDAWSSELAKIATSAMLAQQTSSIQSLRAICESTNANITHIEQTVGAFSASGFGSNGSSLLRDVGCLVYLARELGLQEVADYWRAVLRIDAYQTRRLAQRISDSLPGGTERRDVAILGFTSSWTTIEIGNTSATRLVRELMSSGVKVDIYNPHMPKEQIERALGLVSGHLDAVTVVEDLHAACSGCGAVVLHAEWDEFKEDRLDWEKIAGGMESPKVLCDPHGMLDWQRMEKLGFKVLRPGVNW
ncbi:putative UDP-glucose dehydrogenase Ugd1 [Aspergillus novofumigatus IBT 16806]|uniref:UDP-glucose 6-dehydrogenase n=1 Tax=Aspergillus novofumigatus (strain IBT 16806) TaxID=1392255 RepID=A0A2I1BXD2_ASPN1|nr:putative UDP-glucose dehydrogenase Ugd1 [Aspergillus novofumigatus IBT 16806]PKX90028.1 putative UDP-glucose dehydrogenase Ugd1 [Aspergillus novofumigatus IBT 16806]